MSEPRHIYIDPGHVLILTGRETLDEIRFTRTQGDEYRALIERARNVDAGNDAEMYRLIADMLAWLEGTP